MWTGTFWKNLLERMIKTFAQAAAALLTGEGLGLLDINWTNLLSVAGLAALYSLLTSIANPGPLTGPPPSSDEES